jgi:hypothetical protein
MAVYAYVAEHRHFSLCARGGNALRLFGELMQLRQRHFAPFLDRFAVNEGDELLCLPAALP